MRTNTVWWKKYKPVAQLAAHCALQSAQDSDAIDLVACSFAAACERDLDPYGKLLQSRVVDSDGVRPRWRRSCSTNPTIHPFCFARDAAAILVSVIAGVLASGSILSWITAGLPDACASLNAFGKSSVFSTSTPKPPNDFA